MKNRPKELFYSKKIVMRVSPRFPPIFYQFPQPPTQHLWDFRQFQDERANPTKFFSLFFFVGNVFFAPCENRTLIC